MSEKKVVAYAVSDSTGKTAKHLMESAVGQFPEHEIRIKTFSFVRSLERINEIIEKAKAENAIIAYTFVKTEMREHLNQAAGENNLQYIDMMEKPLAMVAARLKIEPREEFALKYKLDEEYFKRIKAMEFTLKFDDLNESKGIAEADIVLVGVSRTSKTPLSVHLSYLGYKTANVPLVPEVDVHPSVLEDNAEKVVGLTIDPEKLNDIRIERLKKMGLGDDATYAAKERITEEFEYADSIMEKIGCPIIDVTDKTIEETAVEVLSYFND
ncbi:MAG: pyruvate, water dikinase regulatory protein [Halanaerobiales bacterium]|nr:pyruvate, water dikinase regulatory protein [Halanaerobiales bacterium]